MIGLRPSLADAIPQWLGMWARKPTVSPVAAFQSLGEPSLDPETMRHPSGENPQAHTGLAWPRSVSRQSPLAAPQTRSVVSPDPETRRLPSGENAHTPPHGEASEISEIHAPSRRRFKSATCAPPLRPPTIPPLTENQPFDAHPDAARTPEASFGPQANPSTELLRHMPLPWLPLG